ncbi:MAG: TonB-dependent receptor [Novosphingobium sp.]|nr:TonB-dependent receptor [Novosphingobium sp.]
MAISAFSGEALQSQGINTTKDLTLVTPGLNMTQSSFSPQPTIRGIGTRGVSASEESVVPVYIDGVYQPFLASTVLDLNNVERIEVLRGPQTALYGRNSTGGAINIITYTPSQTPAMRASISYGRFNEIIAKGYVSAGTEFIQADLAALYSTDDGYLADLQRPGTKRGWSRSHALRGKIRLTPADNLEVILAGTTMRHDDTLSTSSQPYKDNTTARRLSPDTYVSLKPFQQNGTGGELNQKSDNASLTVRLGLDSIDVTSIVGYDKSYLYTFADVDGSALNVTSLPTDYYSKSWVQELYATSANDGPFNWIIGETYFWRDSGSYRSQTLSGVNVATDASGTQITKALAFYAQGTYAMTDALKVTLAGRYTTEKKEHSYRNNLTGATTAESRTFNDFSPSATLQYTFSPDANIYLRGGKGFKSGLYAATTPSYDATGATNSVRPEKVWQYELGTKFRVAGLLNVNLAGFYTDYSNLQVNIRPNNVSRLQNAGKAEIYGLEGEISARPVDRLNLHLGFMKLWGSFKDFADAQGNIARTDLYPTPANAQTAGCPVLPGTPIGGGVACTFDASGKHIIRTPMFTISGSFNYEIPFENDSAMTLAANFYHAGKEYRDADNRVTLPGYTVVNGEIGYRLPSSDVKLSLWARNIFNEVYNIYILTGATADTTVYAKPRTIGMRLDARF